MTPVRIIRAFAVAAAFGLAVGCMGQSSTQRPSGGAQPSGGGQQGGGQQGGGGSSGGGGQQGGGQQGGGGSSGGGSSGGGSSGGGCRNRGQIFQSRGSARRTSRAGHGIAPSATATPMST
jgi:hypothetical protein